MCRPTRCASEHRRRSWALPLGLPRPVVTREAGVERGSAVTSAVSTHDVDEIVASAIRVARLGEADLRNWWGSRAFGAAGRVVLKQRLPRTWRMAAVELDMASATNRHNDVIDRPNAVHLFSDRWPVRRWATAWVAEQKTEDEPSEIFELLETATLEAIEADLCIDEKPKVESLGDALRVGTIERSLLGEPAAVADAVRTLVAAYVGLETFAAPFLEVTD